LERSSERTGRRRFLREGLGAAVLTAAASEALAKVKPTEPNILGPYHRPGAPFRVKLSAPNEPGEVLIIRGRVLNTDEEPLKGAALDVWQANAAGRYDNDDRTRPPDPDTFLLRGQMKVREDGRYEFQSVLPGRYLNGDTYRPRHVHVIATCPGYRPLTTQIYFDGDPYNEKDPFVRKSLIIPLERRPAAGDRKAHLTGTFDIVLARPGEQSARATPAVDGPAHEVTG
jgi:protocatechuate 3,4-dioxygenase beta subunit